MPTNPIGFPERLRYLMDGEGLTSRDLSARTGGQVSHATIENWLSDSTRAGDSVDIVAKALGWDPAALFYGHPPNGAATRIAELEGALGKLRRALATAAVAVEDALGKAETGKTLTVEEAIATAVPMPRPAPPILRPMPRPGSPAPAAARKKGRGGH